LPRNLSALSRSDLDPLRFLTKDWLEQSKLYHKHAVRLAEAKYSLNRAKAAEAVAEEELKDVIARMDSAIRRDPEAFGLSSEKKPTEAAIENTVRLSSEFQEARDAVFKDAATARNDAQHLVDVLYATVNSLDQRKEALQDLVKLEGRDQFAQPRADKPNRERMDEVETEKAFGPKKKAKQR
jgi:hypothetical protein